MVHEIRFQEFPDNPAIWKEFVETIKNPLTDLSFVSFADQIYLPTDPFNKRMLEELSIIEQYLNEFNTKTPENFELVDQFVEAPYLLAVMAAYAMVKQNAKGTIILEGENNDTCTSSKIKIKIEENTLKINYLNQTITYNLQTLTRKSNRVKNIENLYTTLKNDFDRERRKEITIQFYPWELFQQHKKETEENPDNIVDIFEPIEISRVEQFDNVYYFFEQRK